MTEKEFLLIKKIIENDTKNKNIDNLKKMRKMLNQSIAAIDNEHSTIDIDDYYEILIQNLHDFIHENISSDERKGRLLNLLIRAVAMKKNINPNDVCVFDTLTVTKNSLLNSYRIGEATINYYEQLLNRYGLSMKYRLTSDQILKLNSSRIKRASR